MPSLPRNPRYQSMLCSRPIPSAIALLALVSACGGRDATQTAKPAPAGSLLSAAASTTPSLGSAASFAILASTAVTCTNSTVAGNVGVYPGATITQTICPVTGAIDAGNTVAAQAHNDFVLAYDAFKALPCGQTLTTLDGLSLSPGVYCFDAAATSTGGVLTLNGPSNGTWIFKVGTLGTGALTGTNFSVVMASGAAPACGSVYWWVAEAVTMTDSKFVGTILAGQAVTLTRGTFNGDALSKAAVTVTGGVATSCASGSGGGNPPPSCKASDFVTGGGFIESAPSGSKATFAVSGGIKNGAFRGHLTYQDHGRGGTEVKGSAVTAYVALDGDTRRIEGRARVNGRPGFTYQVDVSDKGEPGGHDEFALRLHDSAGASVYSVSGKLEGGNIKLHKARCDEDGGDGDDGDSHDGDDQGGDDHGGGDKD